MQNLKILANRKQMLIMATMMDARKIGGTALKTIAQTHFTYKEPIANIVQ